MNPSKQSHKASAKKIIKQKFETGDEIEKSNVAYSRNDLFDFSRKGGFM